MLRPLLFCASFQRFGVALGLATLAACSSGSGPGNDAVANATSQNEQKINTADVTAKQEADAQFLVKATSNALLEAELGKLLQARGTTPSARSYGARLVPSRLELLAALRALAEAKKLALPPALGEDEQAAYHEASGNVGLPLDKQAVALLAKAQKQDENAFDDMKDDAYDGDIRGFAAKYLPAVQEQRAATKELAKALDDLP